MISPKVKAVFFFCLALTFGVLIFGGYAINKEKPPIPAKVLDHSGSTLFTGEDVIGGQNYLVPRRETWKSAFLTLLPDAS